MSPGDAVADALDVLAAERTPYLTLRETIDLLGGTRAASAAFGVTQRTVQRWITSSGEKRRLSAAPRAVRDAVAREQRDLAAEQLREELKRGYSVQAIYFELHISKDTSWRDKEDIDIEAPEEDDIDALIDAWLDDDKSGMAAAFQSSFLGGWGMGRLDAGSIEQIDGLSLATRG